VFGDVPAELEVGRFSRRFRDCQACQQAEDGDAQGHRRDNGDALAGQDEYAAGNGADQDGEERAGFDQRIAAEQFVGRQMRRQDAVF